MILFDKEALTHFSLKDVSCVKALLTAAKQIRSANGAPIGISDTLCCRSWIFPWLWLTEATYKMVNRMEKNVLDLYHVLSKNNKRNWFFSCVLYFLSYN